MDHFADEFNAKLGGDKDVRSSPKAMAKLRAQVRGQAGGGRRGGAAGK